MSGPNLFDRRSLVIAALTAGAGLAVGPAAFAQVKKTVARQASGGPTPGSGRKFFTTKEFAILDEISEMIIPADGVSGGARATKVPEFLDQSIGESVDLAWRQSWRDDLAEIDRLSIDMFGRPFVKASYEQRTRLLGSISGNEKAPSAAGEYAFGTIKWSVANVYYRTRVGIHDDLRYQGNVAQAEFAGTDVGSR